MKIKLFYIIPVLLLSFVTLQAGVKVGAERLDILLPLLQQKRVALVVNHTSQVGNIHLLDTLRALDVNVKTIFSPEHGFRGDADAGKTIKDGRDEKTGIPIVSLYGRNKKPTCTQLQDIDVILFDIQDVGARFYTYISTMHYVMEAAAECGKEMIVLDRPNPNDFVDGPVLLDSMKSFVGMHPIPVLHGLTVGELARMINGEGWLKNRMKTDLTVIPVEGWKHGDSYSLPVKPSPNLPNMQATRLYPSLCLFEATQVSIGRGTYFPFQVIGYPDPEWGSFSFTPRSLVGYDTSPVQKDKACYGIDLRDSVFEGGFTLRFFIDAWNKAGKKSSFFQRPRWFDLLMGTPQVRRLLVEGKSEAELRKLWQPELNKYKQMREKYLLY
ncbi:MAG: DUF1343 domain-containing protein [Bacteroidales bacterium]|nr:DUF1343 domain-containing protein [Bacteroidales bacterium]